MQKPPFRPFFAVYMKGLAYNSAIVDSTTSIYSLSIDRFTRQPIYISIPASVKCSIPSPPLIPPRPVKITVAHVSAETACFNSPRPLLFQFPTLLSCRHSLRDYRSSSNEVNEDLPIRLHPRSPRDWLRACR